MDVLVMLEESPDHSPVLAHVNTAPSSLAPQRAARDIVTLYGVPNVELLALALAAAVVSAVVRTVGVRAAAAGRAGRGRADRGYQRMRPRTRFAACGFARAPHGRADF